MISRPRRLFGQAALAATAAALLFLGSPSQAQRTGPFANFHGNWSGGGTLTLSSGTRERIRCRAQYAVDGSGANVRIELRCASDSYKFELTGNATHNGNEISGTWNETGRGAGGTLSGTARGTQISMRASGATFSALLSLNTTPGKQSISIESPGSELSSVSINLNKS